MQLIPLRKGLWQRLFPRFRVSEDFIYEFDYEGERAGFIIPAGYTFDGATGAQFITDNDAVHVAASGHDLAYECLGATAYYLYRDVYETFEVDRALIDKIFITKIKEAYGGASWKITLYRIGIKTIGALIWQLRKYNIFKTLGRPQ